MMIDNLGPALEKYTILNWRNFSPAILSSRFAEMTPIKESAEAQYTGCVSSLSLKGFSCVMVEFFEIFPSFCEDSSEVKFNNSPSNSASIPELNVIDDDAMEMMLDSLKHQSTAVETAIMASISM
jgi:hypothetical protein